MINVGSRKGQYSEPRHAGNIALTPSAGRINHLRTVPLAKRLTYGHICFSFTDHAKRLPSGLEHRTTA